MNRCIVYIILTMLALSACEKSISLETEDTRIVVDGWIEDGEFPVVMLTRSVPVSTEYHAIDSLWQYLIRWAKVVVIDGTDSVILTGKYDNRYNPPYIYTTGKLRGVAGREYKLIVDYKEFHATATTTIPLQKPKATFRVKRCNDSDSLYDIIASIDDDPLTKNYYQLFSRVGGNNLQYLASYLGAIDDVVLKGHAEVSVYQGHQIDKPDYTPYYSLNDTVGVKVSGIDAMSYTIWDTYTKTLSLSENMFIATSTDMKSNISGGYGYWCGYNSVMAYFIIGK